MKIKDQRQYLPNSNQTFENRFYVMANIAREGTPEQTEERHSNLGSSTWQAFQSLTNEEKTFGEQAYRSNLSIK